MLPFGSHTGGDNSAFLLLSWHPRTGYCSSVRDGIYVARYVPAPFARQETLISRLNLIIAATRKVHLLARWRSADSAKVLGRNSQTIEWLEREEVILLCQSLPISAKSSAKRAFCFLFSLIYGHSVNFRFKLFRNVHVRRGLPCNNLWKNGSPRWSEDVNVSRPTLLRFSFLPTPIK